MREGRAQGAKAVTRAIKSRNGGTWTEARFWQQVRSGLRRAFRFWRPIQQCLMAARRPYKGPSKLAKWHFLCGGCGELFLRKDVQVHHKVECGQLKKPEDIAPFLGRLTTEDPSAYVVLCKKCHKKTHSRENPQCLP